LVTHKAKEAPPKRAIARSKPDLARALGRGVRQITEYLQRGMPGDRRRGYPIDECRAWMEAQIKPSGRAAGPAPGTPGSRGYWETRDAQARAELKELELARRKGELIEVEVVARRSERRIAEAKALLEQIPDWLLGLLPRTMSAAAKKDLRRRTGEKVDDIMFALAAAAEEDAPAETAEVEPEEDVEC